MHDELSQHDTILVDRLVDGELSAAERRELISSLDVRPGGWRQCALAFLEAQTWRHELGLVAREPLPADETALAQSHVSEPEWNLNWLAIAASALIAFTLGLALRHPSRPHQLAAPSPFQSQIATQSQVATGAVSQGAAASGNDVLTLWVRDEAGQARPLRVPLVDARELDRQLGMQFPTRVPNDVRNQLQQNGYQVQSKQRYAPMWLDNGRPLVVPVEDAQIVPVSQVVY